MDTKELRALDTNGLLLRLEQTRKELMNQRFQYALGLLADTSRLRITRKTIAQILTILREREREAAQEGNTK
jgi:large subunit ribosomal protein L29